MKKPICLSMEELEQDLANIINRYRNEGLPCFLIEPIMQKLHAQVASIKANEVAAVKRSYEDDLRKAAEAATAESEVEKDGD